MRYGSDYQTELAIISLNAITVKIAYMDRTETSYASRKPFLALLRHESENHVHAFLMSNMFVSSKENSWNL
jgi:hypothetical protein